MQRYGHRAARRACRPRRKKSYDRGVPRKVCVFIAISLDGRIAGPNDDISWLSQDQDYGYEDFYEEIDTVVMGRKTFEVSLAFGEYPYEGVETVVFSTNKIKKHDKATFSIGPISGVVTKLKAKEGRKIWLVGGAGVISDCLEAGLVDELRLFVHPLIVGAGTPLFRPGIGRVPLVFVSAQSFATGVVELRYRAP